jgi:hypothetical protein
MHLDLCLFVGIGVGIVGEVANVIARKGPPLGLLMLTAIALGCADPGPAFEGDAAVPTEEMRADGKATDCASACGDGACNVQDHYVGGCRLDCEETDQNTCGDDLCTSPIEDLFGGCPEDCD